jgi:cephalosporin hydroxylase
MTERRQALLAVLCLVGGALLGVQLDRTLVDAEPSPSPPQRCSRQQLIDGFHNLVYDSLLWDQMKWLGVHAQQNPSDVWSYQQILFETKPDFVIEAGTNHGGGALLWATLLSVINPEAKVFTIDIEDKHEAARQVPLFREKVEFFLGSSTSEQVFNVIRERVGKKKVVVILDSNHAKDHVLAEMLLYGDLVSVGSYLLVQDTNVNGHPVLPGFGPGPWEAVEAFMAAGARSKGGALFEIDRSRELLFSSMHPKGYLKRVQ